MTKYLLDANVFIQGKNFYYGMDFCPAFWDWILQQNAVNVVFSIDKVFEELARGNDELAIWAKKHQNLFLPTDAKTVEQFPKVSQWVQTQPFTTLAKNEFFSVADFYLIAQALAIKNCSIVTFETFDPLIRKRIKIPNVCAAFSIPYTNVFDLVRTTKEKFILEK